MSLPRLKSSVPGIVFPALPNPSAASQLALQYQFEQTQWWSPEDLQEYQFEQLRNLLFFTFNNSPFWKKRAKDHKLDKRWISELTPETFSQLPPLRRSELQQDIDSIRPPAIPKEHGGLSETRTSGSTGTPVVAYGTGVTRALWNAFSLRDHLWHKRDFRLKLAAIRSLPKKQARAPHGQQTRGWGSAVANVFNAGHSLMLNVSEPVDVQYEWLLRHDPDYLITHPSNLMALAQHASKHPQKLSQLKQVRGVGETVTPVIRDTVREVFDCEVADMYSCQEAGYIALQCAEHGSYHVMSEGIYLEIVDDDYNPVKKGEQGKVLITNLNNFATPMIRYELGDIAVMGETCQCGRGLPVLEKILGRTRNMLLLPDGSVQWPYVGFFNFIQVADIKQFQVIQHSFELVEFLVAVDQEFTEKQKNEIVEILRKALGHPFNIQISYVDEIPRSKSGKYEDFVSKISDETKK